MRKFRFDKARKEMIIDGERYKAQTLEYFIQQNTFDKHLSEFINYKGLTFVLSNPAGNEDEEIFFPINLQYQDVPENDRLMMMKSDKEREEIQAILDEYGY